MKDEKLKDYATDSVAGIVKRGGKQNAVLQNFLYSTFLGFQISRVSPFTDLIFIT